MDHYQVDKGQFRGAWLTEGDGLVITRDPNFSISEFSDLVKASEAICIRSLSPRLNRGDKCGARIQFTVAKGFSVKFASSEQVSLIKKLVDDKANVLATQIRRGGSISISADESAPALSLSEELSANPVIIVLSGPKINERNKSEPWLRHATFRVIASSNWIISRPQACVRLNVAA